MPVRPGGAFKEGDRLIRFACGPFVAQRDVATAELEAMEKQLAATEKLLALNAVGPLDVAIAAANRDKAAAQVRLHQESVNRCSIRAPFNGQVIAWHARPHEAASPGVELIEIVDTEGLELEMIVPSGWLSWLKPGLPLSLSVDETGDAYNATLAVIGAEVDAVSQTIAVRAQFDAHPGNLIPGMSGIVVFPSVDP